MYILIVLSEYMCLFLITVKMHTRTNPSNSQPIVKAILSQSLTFLFSACKKTLLTWALMLLSTGLVGTCFQSKFVLLDSC